MRRRGTKPRRAVAKGDVVIPKKGVWAGEECLVLYVEKRPQPYGYYQIVRVLLPNQRQRCYPLTEIKEIIPAKGAILTKPRQQGSDAKVPNEKLKRIRDEAHRFALSYHLHVRRKAALTSAWSVPGIGPKRKRALLKKFGSVRAIKEASIEDLMEVPSMTRALAQRVKEGL